MKTKAAILSSLILLAAAPASAGFQEGVTAYKAKDYVKALEEWRPLAEQGSVAAQFNLGYMYHKGQGTEQDHKEAARWYLLAAEQGDAEAQFNIGVLLNKGQGVTQSYTEAVKWYAKSAEQGDADAQNNLGSVYAKGEGVPQDYIQAHKWFNLAATKMTGEGHDIAVANREIVAGKMTAAQIATAQKLAKEWWEEHKDLMQAKNDKAE